MPYVVDVRKKLHAASSPAPSAPTHPSHESMTQTPPGERVNRAHISNGEHRDETHPLKTISQESPSKRRRWWKGK